MTKMYDWKNKKSGVTARFLLAGISYGACGHLEEVVHICA